MVKLTRLGNLSGVLTGEVGIMNTPQVSFMRKRLYRFPFTDTRNSRKGAGGNGRIRRAQSGHTEFEISGDIQMGRSNKQLYVFLE